MATARPIVLTAEEEQTLRMWTRAGTTEQRLARRAQVILLCAEGLPIREVGERCGLSLHIPSQPGHPFQAKATTHSEPKRPPIPT